MDNVSLITEYEPLEGCYGTITGRCCAGAYLQLDNGQEAFAYQFANLPFGTIVLCTVKKKASEIKKTLVSVDSIIQYADFAA